LQFISSALPVIFFIAPFSSLLTQPAHFQKHTSQYVGVRPVRAARVAFCPSVSSEAKSLKPAAPANTAPVPIAEILMNCLRVAIYQTVFLRVVNMWIEQIVPFLKKTKILFFN
jgi:hypothetical protein